MRRILRVSTVSALLLTSALACAACRGGNDARIDQEVKEQLGPTTSAGTPVTISTKDRIVMLQGVVRTAGERQELENTVRRVDGVLAVDNRLTVAAPTETTGAPVEKGERR